MQRSSAALNCKAKDHQDHLVSIQRGGGGLGRWRFLHFCVRCANLKSIFLLTAGGVGSLCTILGIAVDVLNQDGL